MKFSATRRGVLALLGAAPAAPLAAKAMLDKELAVLTGVSPNIAGSIPHAYGSPPPQYLDATASTGPDAETLAADFFDLFGLPDHIRDQLYERSRPVSYFDPDIAAKRSWSHSVKVATQRERNFAQLKEKMRDGIAQNRKTKAFKKVTGFYWPFY